MAHTSPLINSVAGGGWSREEIVIRAFVPYGVAAVAEAVGFVVVSDLPKADLPIAIVSASTSKRSDTTWNELLIVIIR